MHRGQLSADTASGVHTHKDPQSANKSEPVASSHSRTAESGTAPGGPFPALPRRPRGAGGAERRNRPLYPPGSAPEHTGEARKRPGLCRGARRCRAPVPRRTARPSRPRGWHRPLPPAEEGWGSEFTLSPSPPLPPAGTAAMAPRPACGGPAVSLLWSLGAVEQLPLLGPRPVLRAGIPLPSEEMRRRRGCVSERKAGESGEQSGSPACGRERCRGVTELRPGCTTPCPASPLTRVPGSPAPYRPARSAGSGDSLRSAPLSHPTSSRPGPGAGCNSARGRGRPAAASQAKFDRGRCGDKNNRR